MSTPSPVRLYPAKILRVIDGDTYDVEVDLGFRIVARLPLRLAHVDAPEKNTPEGKLTAAFVANLFGTLPCAVNVTTYKPIDKYGRYLADVDLEGVGDLANLLVKNGLAKGYEGGGR